jgi:hypothetical protein
MRQGTGRSEHTGTPGNAPGDVPGIGVKAQPSAVRGRYLHELENRARLTDGSTGSTVGVGQPAATRRARGGAPVVVGGRESRPQGEGGQLGTVPISGELSRSEDVCAEP